MEAVQQIVPLLLTFSLAGLVVAVGLNASRQDLLSVLRRPRLLIRAIAAVDLIPPAAGILLTSLLPIEPVVKAGIVLMAIAPVPPLVPGQELSVGARKEYAYGLYVAMALLTVFVVPAALWVVSQVAGREVAVPLSQIVKTVVTGVLIPLAIGVAIRVAAPAVAARIAPLLYGLSMILIGLAFAPIIVSIWPAIEQIVGNGAVATMGLVVIISLVGGHMLGGPDRIDRGTLAVASAVRHPGIAMMLASANFTDKRVTAAVLTYMLVGLVIGMPYKQWIKRTTKPHAANLAPHAHHR